MKTIFISALVAAILSGCAGYVPGRQEYWDAQVREMCAKDGGVTIYQKVRISKIEKQALGTVGGLIGIPAKELAKPNAPVYEELNIFDLREGNPRVSRSEMLIVRRADSVIVAKAISYARSDGDIPSPAHPSSFSCPDFKSIITALQQLFTVEEDLK